MCSKHFQHTVKIFLLPLEGGQTYQFKITPNLGEKWSTYGIYLMRIENAEGEVLASNIPNPRRSVGPVPGRLTVQAPKTGTYRLVMPCPYFPQRGFTLSVNKR